MRLCPRSSFTSSNPPSAIRINLRLSALAIEFAKEVLPTPGGPAKHKIAPVADLSAMPRLAKSSRTAKNSSMRSLGFSKE